MLKLSRVCVPLSLDCNLHCKYCYRDKERLDKIPEFTEDMKEYLRNLSPAWCECVCASGGEPLFHWDKVVELFSYVPKNVHKKIMSNCTLLTQEMVDYINENEIELHFSHDGKMTKFLRGVDVLEDEKICDLIRQVKILLCFSVVTKYNTNVWENFFDTVHKLGRFDFGYNAKPLDDVSPAQQFLVEGFNYNEWLDTWLQFKFSPFYIKLPWYDGATLTQYNPGHGRGVGANVLPDGRLCGMINICSDYGTIHSTREEYFNKAMATGLTDYCVRTKCAYADRCNSMLEHTSNHICTCRKMLMDCSLEKVAEARQYVYEHMPEILGRYGFGDVAEKVKVFLYENNH